MVGIAVAADHASSRLIRLHDRGSDPSAPLDPGNGFLMRHGYTVVWCGWQADVPPAPGLMGLQAPEATSPDGSRLGGKILCEFQANEPTKVFMLSHRGHLPHPPANANDSNKIASRRNRTSNTCSTFSGVNEAMR